MVYFMQSLDKIKVGYTSNNPTNRKRSMETGNPHGIVLIGTVNGTREHEEKIHKQLQKYCVRGEWFRDCEAVRDYVHAVLSNKKVVKYERHLYDGSVEIAETSNPKWINQFIKCEKNNLREISLVTNQMHEIEIKINELIGKKKLLDRKYIKLIQKI
jgi:hypothetical protein